MPLLLGELGFCTAAGFTVLVLGTLNLKITKNLRNSYSYTL